MVWEWFGNGIIEFIEGTAVQGALQIARATGPKEFSMVTSQIRLALKPRK